jgi:serine/threonine-protein kinase
MDLPAHFGPYRLEARLGVGGMAEVFRARAFGASGFEKLVCIKTLRAELVGDARFERMFFEEARLQARLSHRNLVQAHDLGVTDGRPWVRLELVDGVDLGSLHLPLPSPIAARIVTEVALGLIALHEATDEAGRPLGIVHRDVSAKNVLLSRWGEVKLADFGIARATQLKEDTRANSRKGTYAYMSPEQVAGRALSNASDQFALATLAVELLTGRRPFDGATPLETMDRIREALLPSLEEIAPTLRPALARAFGKAPGERHPSMRALREAVLAAVTAADELEVAAQVLASAADQATAAPPKTTIDSAVG